MLENMRVPLKKNVYVDDTSVGDISLVGVVVKKIWVPLSRVHLMRVPLFGVFLCASVKDNSIPLNLQ